MKNTFLVLFLKELWYNPEKKKKIKFSFLGVKMKIGYARVSTEEQNLDRQLD